MNSASMRQRLRQYGNDSLRARLDGPGDDVASGTNVVFRARFECYRMLGFTREQAFLLAMAPEVGVIDALDLIESDCPADTAVAILV